MVGARRWFWLGASGLVALTLVYFAVRDPGKVFLIWLWLQSRTPEVVLRSPGGFVYAARDPLYAARVVDAARCRAPGRPMPGEPTEGLPGNYLCEPPILELAVKRGAVLKLPDGTRAREGRHECVSDSGVGSCPADGRDEVAAVTLTDATGKQLLAWVSTYNLPSAGPWP